MSERRANETFESRFAQQVRAYTDRAPARPFDALAVARSAMSRPASGWPRRTVFGQSHRRPDVQPAWAIGLVAVVLIGVVGAAVLGRRSDRGVGPRPTQTSALTPAATTASRGPTPAVLRQAWERPIAITPGMDRWGSGSLVLTGDAAAYGPVPGAPESRSQVASTGPDSLVITAIGGTVECASAAIGTYRWSVAGQDTVLTLTPVGADSCPAREVELAGDWVRADLRPADGGPPMLPPGTYLTNAFDPLGTPGQEEQLSYTVPRGWRVLGDRSATLTLQRLPAATGSPASADVYVVLFAEPRIASDNAAGNSCNLAGVAPRVGHDVGAMIGAIIEKPRVVSTPPARVTIGGFEGRLVDLTLLPDGTLGCFTPDGGSGGVPILLGAGSEPGPFVGLGPGQALRLILLELTGGRIMAIAIGSVGTAGPVSFEDQVADVMPLVESFEFHPRAP